MSINRYEAEGRIITEHPLSREQLYTEMKAIEDLVDARFGLRGIPLAIVQLYIDPADSAHNVTLRYEESPGPINPPRTIGEVHLVDAAVRIDSKQIAQLVGRNRTAFNPLIIYDNPPEGIYYANSQEAATAIRERLTHVFEHHPHREK